MNKKEIRDILKKSLGMPIGDVSDEWKSPSVVCGESNGVLFVQTRADSKQEAKDLRDKVKAALSDKYDIGQGIIEFNSVEVRFFQSLTIFSVTK